MEGRCELKTKDESKLEELITREESCKKEINNVFQQIINFINNEISKKPQRIIKNIRLLKFILEPIARDGKSHPCSSSLSMEVLNQILSKENIISSNPKKLGAIYTVVSNDYFLAVLEMVKRIKSPSHWLTKKNKIKKWQPNLYASLDCLEVKINDYLQCFDMQYPQHLSENELPKKVSLLSIFSKTKKVPKEIISIHSNSFLLQLPFAMITEIVKNLDWVSLIMLETSCKFFFKNRDNLWKVQAGQIKPYEKQFIKLDLKNLSDKKYCITFYKEFKSKEFHYISKNHSYFLIMSWQQRNLAPRDILFALLNEKRFTLLKSSIESCIYWSQTEGSLRNIFNCPMKAKKAIAALSHVRVPLLVTVDLSYDEHLKLINNKQIDEVIKKISKVEVLPGYTYYLKRPIPPCYVTFNEEKGCFERRAGQNILKNIESSLNDESENINKCTYSG